MGILLLTLGLLVHVSMSNPPCNTVEDCPQVPDNNCPDDYKKELVCCHGECDCCSWGDCCEQVGCAGQQGDCHDPYEGGCEPYDDCRQTNRTTQV
ncbi:unnamed protein product [Orchesella dallaii]|uniref:Uncharacterized protein n=1 Tax=Orchesella dallaii TaxID=48710 RepID=A0ABP1R2V9_9HEXA